MRARLDTEHGHSSSLDAKEIMKNLTYYNPKQEVENYVTSELPSRIHRKKEGQRCIRYSHAHEPI